jgi:uncharacterized protein YbbC (DUF1343 family)
MAHFKLWTAVVSLSMTIFACAQKPLQTGADQMPLLLTKLAGKRIALMVNQTSVVGKAHLVDSLQSHNVDIKKILAVEHGFRGSADAGEVVGDGVDAKTGVPIVSLYGKNHKPTPTQMEDVDVVVFDIQDVGVRFFTYISSLHYLMEACAETGKKLIVLDRPNPNGALVDGPILDMELKSFVGMHPIPIAHGMTIGEYARMVNDEGWLAGGKKCELEVVPMKNWKHSDFYSIRIKPSPNLTTDQGIALYPSTCLFEGTVLSIGRGTQNPFELVGHPELKGKYSFQFTPVSIEGMAKEPVLKGQACFGLDLRKVPVKKEIDLRYLLELYNAFPDKQKFFNNYFDKLAGTKELKNQIVKGMTDAQIKATWKPGLDKFKSIRKKYLLYP